MSKIDNIYDQLKRDEGLRLKPYVDTTGNITIGFGHNLTANGITLHEAEEMLTHDVTSCQVEVSAALPWTAQLSDPRHGVIDNMAYNLGIEALVGFRVFLDDMKKGLFQEAAYDLRTTLAYKQDTARYERLAKQLETNEWQ